MYKSTSLTGEWTEIKDAVEKPADYSANRWAPEVHKYGGKYYMFTTYTPTTVNNGYGNRGCIIMEADSPEGPFKMITDGWITPKEWDCIDGTLYVDGDGQPWMVFVHEHTSFADDNGAFCAAKLSEDLTHFISEPIELFRARDPEWAQAGITDGCFMYTTADGALLMLWSNYDPGYCVAIARSSNGKLDGEWLHDTDFKLYSTLTVAIGGGHGMLFTDTDGQMYLTIHSPDVPAEGENSKVTILPVIERNGTLVWDLNLD